VIAAAVLLAVLLALPRPDRSRLSVAPAPGGVPVTDPALVLDLIATAVESGADLPRALATVGRAIDGGPRRDPDGDTRWAADRDTRRATDRDTRRAADGDAGAVLCRVATALLVGSDWTTAWEGAPTVVLPVRDALGPAWTAGVSAVPALRSAAVEERRRRRRLAQEACARLAVRLVLPLGLCFLPAFVLIGVVPVLISFAGRLGW
jgi:hypothetical protein